MIKTHNLSFSYSLENTFNFPDFTCLPKETILITGKSGVGKTTLLHLLAGLQKPHSGSIFIDETDIVTLKDKSLDNFRGKNIGMILQQSHFLSSLTVLENLEMIAWINTGKKQTSKIEEILCKLDIENQKNKLTSNLSVGQQQRVSIARALLNEPKLILADEPTSNLDDENAALVANLLASLSQDFNASLLLVTHDSRLKEIFSNQINLV